MELHRYRPPDPHQVQLREDFLAHLAAHPDACSRHCAPAHLTASALVMDPAGRRVVLILHRKVGLWLPAGGHCEPTDATLAGAARREATEETGLANLTLLPGPVLLDRHRAPCSTAIEHHLDVMYLTITAAGATPVPSHESTDVGWFPADDLPEPTDDAVRALVGVGVARLRAGAGVQAGPNPDGAS